MSGRWTILFVHFFRHWLLWRWLGWRLFGRQLLKLLSRRPRRRCRGLLEVPPEQHSSQHNRREDNNFALESDYPARGKLSGLSVVPRCCWFQLELLPCIMIGRLSRRFHQIMLPGRKQVQSI